jgi:hypothetical protein
VESEGRLNKSELSAVISARVELGELRIAEQKFTCGLLSKIQPIPVFILVVCVF